MSAATVRGQAESRVNLSILHMLSAASHSRRVGDLEQEHSTEDFGEFWNEIFASASAAVFTSVAALESYANELFIDHKRVFPQLRVEVMAKLWELYEQKPTLEKFEFALLLKEGPTFDRGGSPFQEVFAIMKLRNALIHFKPEWFSEQEEHAKISALLQHRATLSPFFPPSEPLFPRGWASYKTVKWVINSAVAFLLDFERRAEVDKRMGKFASRLSEI